MQFTPRSTEVLLFQGEDYAEFQELLAAVERANAPANRRVGDGDGGVKAAADAYDAFVAEAAERALKIRLRAVGHRKWRELLAAHPPRDDNRMDQMRGFNTDTLGDDLVPASLMAGDFDSDDERDAFLDMLPAADWNRLYSEALSLNEDAGPDPKVQLSSLLGETSPGI